MTFRHVVMFVWTEDATEAQKQQVADAISTLPGILPQIQRYEFGPDAGINAGNKDFAIVADFADAESYLVYRDDPRHQAMIKEFIAPILASRSAVQYTF